MKTLVATDIHIIICNGRYFVPTQVSSILKRYYDCFNKFTVCARVTYADEISSSVVDITDIIKELVVIPSLEKTIPGLYNKKIEQAVKNSDFVICRCHGIIAHRAADYARKHKKRYFAEVIGCGWDAFWNHGIEGKIVAPYVFFKMKQTVYNADYAIYVTNEFLQNRYPCKNESVGISDVLIEDADEAVIQRRLDKIKNTEFCNLTIMTTAAVDVPYKGQEFVIKAIPALNKAGIHIRYLLVGGGEQAHLKGVAKKCGVEEQVEFLGRRSLSEVFELLNDADIYIQPSLQEGLPRSVIEAMSRGCPVIGARTAGIPELIDSECVVRRKSVKDIAQTIIRIANREKMTELAKRNFEEAKKYQESILSERRNSYYQRVLREQGEYEQH